MICAIILAAGTSSRFKSDVPKQFQTLNGKLVIDYSIRAFLSCSSIDRLVIVVPPKKVQDLQNLYSDHIIVEGGFNRKSSSFNGLLACPQGTNKILIHDAARALINKDLIERCIEKVKYYDAVSTVIPVKDTVVKIENNKIIEIPDRNQIYLEQTPQAFTYKVILDAHKNIDLDVTDDIKLVKEAGIEPAIIYGYENNFKITTKDDFLLAEILLKEKK